MRYFSKKGNPDICPAGRFLSVDNGCHSDFVFIN